MVASARAGRIRCLSASHDASHSRVRMPSRTNIPVTRVASRPVLWRPETGSRFHSTAKKYLSRNAVKNTGTATPTSEKMTAVGVGARTRPGGRRSSPAGCRARSPARGPEARARWWRATGRGRPGGRPRPAAPWWRRRSCPATARSRNLRYCTGMGWSRPSAASRAARRSGVWRSPSIADTGPPGSDRSQTKTSIDRTRTTTHHLQESSYDKADQEFSSHTPARVRGPSLGRPPDVTHIGRSAGGS